MFGRELFLWKCNCTCSHLSPPICHAQVIFSIAWCHCVVFVLTEWSFTLVSAKLPVCKARIPFFYVDRWTPSSLWSREKKPNTIYRSCSLFCCLCKSKNGDKVLVRDNFFSFKDALWEAQLWVAKSSAPDLKPCGRSELCCVCKSQPSLNSHREESESDVVGFLTQPRLLTITDNNRERMSAVRITPCRAKHSKSPEEQRDAKLLPIKDSPDPAMTRWLKAGMCSIAMVQ